MMGHGKSGVHGLFGGSKILPSAQGSGAGTYPAKAMPSAQGAVYPSAQSQKGGLFHGLFHRD
jgi:hypothetical protein